MMSLSVLFFFFSSRRRHTRLTCDWSSDVCSSDLEVSSREVAGRVFQSVPTQDSRLAAARLCWNPTGGPRARVLACRTMRTARTRQATSEVATRLASQVLVCDGAMGTMLH